MSRQAKHPVNEGRRKRGFKMLACYVYRKSYVFVEIFWFGGWETRININICIFNLKHFELPF